MTLDDWAFKCLGLLSIADTTRKSYTNRYKGRLSPEFGQYELQDITQEQIQLWILSVKPSIAKWYTPVLKTLFREAISYGLTDHNPAAHVKVPKYTPQERDFLPWDVVQDLDFGRYTELARFMALHGLRYSEALAVTEDDIKDGYVHVNKSIHGGRTKSGKARKVPYLGHWERFPTSYKWFRIRCNKHGITPHSLRYTYAHSCKISGIGPQVAQKLLGHSSITLTMDLYTKVLDDELDEAGVCFRALVA